MITLYSNKTTSENLDFFHASHYTRVKNLTYIEFIDMIESMEHDVKQHFEITSNPIHENVLTQILAELSNLSSHCSLDFESIKTKNKLLTQLAVQTNTLSDIKKETKLNNQSSKKVSSSKNKLSTSNEGGYHEKNNHSSY